MIYIYIYIYMISPCCQISYMISWMCLNIRYDIIYDIASLLRTSMTWPAEIYTFGMLTKWSDALVYLWTFYLWTVMRCPLPLCVPQRSAQAAGVPGNNCRILTMCSLSETPSDSRWVGNRASATAESRWNGTRQVQGQGTFLMANTMFIFHICMTYTMYILWILNWISTKFKCDLQWIYYVYP
jgi:hypothetical protein